MASTILLSTYGQAGPILPLARTGIPPRAASGWFFSFSIFPKDGRDVEAATARGLAESFVRKLLLLKSFFMVFVIKCSEPAGSVTGGWIFVTAIPVANCLATIAKQLYLIGQFRKFYN